jgi:hypothetical protein
MSTGIFTSANLPVDFAKKSFAGMITRLMPMGQAPLFGMTAMLPSETAVQTEHGFFTKTMLFPELTLGGAGIPGAADTVLIVVSTTNVLPGMLMRVDSTGEQILVDAILSATSVRVQRGIGTVAAAAAGAGVKIYQTGSAFEESSTRPNALVINPVRITNLTQILRNTWAVSDSVRATLVIAGETNVAESKMDGAAFHAVDIEKNLFWGQKFQGTRNGQPFRTMDGLINIVSTLSNYPPSYAAVNVTTAGATTNYTQLQNALEPLFNQSTDPKVGNERVLFVGGGARRVINDIGRLNGTYQLVDGMTGYGLQFQSFKTARGTFRMIEHPLFNSNASWAKMAVAVDLSTFRVAYLGNRKTQHKYFNNDGENATDNGIDAQGGTYTSELTCVVKNPPANGIIFNLTAGTAG